ncbi:hypothetical protein BC830DRAFT_1143627 [Chytriomyces sp. MP71]|nr:hypothetical protein BC830DRAFT_1143627 [Chytriomyces sp. MP71]
MQGLPHMSGTLHQHYQQSSEDTINNHPTLSYLLDRRFSLPEVPILPLTMPSTPIQHWQPVRMPTMNRRMSLPASNFMYQPSMSELLHGPSPLSTSTLNDPFSLYNQPNSSEALMMLPGDFTTLPSSTQSSPALQSRGATPISFESAFSELLFESSQSGLLGLPHQSHLHGRSRSVSMSTFEMVKQQNGDTPFFAPPPMHQQQEPRFQFPIVEETRPLSRLHESATFERSHVECPPAAEDSAEASPVSPVRVLSAPVIAPTVLEMMKQGEMGGKAQKFKPTETQLNQFLKRTHSLPRPFVRIWLMFFKSNPSRFGSGSKTGMYVCLFWWQLPLTQTY